MERLVLGILLYDHFMFDDIRKTTKCRQKAGRMASLKWHVECDFDYTRGLADLVTFLGNLTNVI